MPRTVLLNNVDHQHLRVLTRPGAEFGDDVMAAVAFPAEFRALQSHYPIVFRKRPDDGRFEAVALLGLQPGQNLFLRGSTWDAAYRPLALERLPFYIGHDGDGLVVHVDLDSPRLVWDATVADAEPVFMPHGGHTPYLERISGLLAAIHQGLQGTPAFVDALLAHELLEPFVLDYVDAGGARQQLRSFYTLHEERLAALPGPALEALSRAGHLQAAYMAVASLSQLQALFERQAALAA